MSVVFQIMRDGIFKTAPLTRKWRRVGNCAEREADHGVRLADALTKALIDDIKKDVLNGLQGLAAFVVRGSLVLLKGDELRKFIQSLEPESRFAKDVIKDINFVCRGGRPFDAQAFIDAIASASKRHVDAVSADMLGHANKKTDTDHLKVVANALKDAIDNLDYSSIARKSLLNNGSNSSNSHGFDLSDNLLD